LKIYATPAEHNWGNTESNYTSWTTKESVAQKWAQVKGTEGVILEKQFIISETTPSLDKYNEAEILVKGIVTGATVHTVSFPLNRSI